VEGRLQVRLYEGWRWRQRVPLPACLWHTENEFVEARPAGRGTCCRQRLHIQGGLKTALYGGLKTALYGAGTYHKITA